MFRGGEFNARWGNRLMRARVALQALAVLLILAFAALMQNSP
ncbi:MAG: HIG1 domain-containing protein [Alphaproteobacteria bacterium]|nr:HIG1 domain-containing protein [Alphaproteobacteria bacterium]